MYAARTIDVWRYPCGTYFWLDCARTSRWLDWCCAPATHEVPIEALGPPFVQDIYGGSPNHMNHKALVHSIPSQIWLTEKDVIMDISPNSFIQTLCLDYLNAYIGFRFFCCVSIESFKALWDCIQVSWLSQCMYWLSFSLLHSYRTLQGTVRAHIERMLLP